MNKTLLLITIRLQSGQVLKQPTWSVGPYQTACGAQSYAVLTRQGSVLFESRDASVVARRAYRMGLHDRKERLRCQY